MLMVLFSNPELKSWTTNAMPRLSSTPGGGIMDNDVRLNPFSIFACEDTVAPHLVKVGTSLAFLTAVLQTYLHDQPIDALTTLLARVQLVDDKLLEFFPRNKRSDDSVAKYFEAAGLKPVVEYIYIKIRRGDVVKARVAEEIKELVSEMKENGWTEAETVTVLWEMLVESVEWSSKPDAFEIQLLKTYPKLLESVCTSPKSEITLLQCVQITCYTDARFLKHFRTIVTLFYKNNIVSEAAVLFWAEKGGALAQGKAVFVKQIELFVEWLKAQEDDSDDEDERRKIRFANIWCFLNLSFFSFQINLEY
ncbi:Basic leucine zipper and W2 domain-containing protein 1 [Physocladia obscura]|uniref:Basic leucine zipper and W2 domain-containing protein 1 n=1 Tax=Physocladia obscura TaxID=109957 RepID=A0AAD5X930_9FUNG|nr:Basic leucine zipper and W2 domain-containing protein 1 [Physocladia obscura]